MTSLAPADPVGEVLLHGAVGRRAVSCKVSESLRGAGAALPAGSLSASSATAAAAGAEEFKAFSLWFDVAELSNTNACIPAWVTARYRDASGSDTWTRLVRTNTNGCDSDPEHLQKFGDFQTTTSRCWSTTKFDL
ncbi:hypothetical protein ACWGDE_04080 [Streptomyces sp. NPDC054956]